MRWGEGSETPSFPRSEHEERGVLRPFSPSQEGVSDPFSHRKKENPVHPQIHCAKIPLAQRITKVQKLSGQNPKQRLTKFGVPAGPRTFGKLCFLLVVVRKSQQMLPERQFTEPGFSRCSTARSSNLSSAKSQGGLER